MIDFEARRIIEALRSGVPSRAVGQYFSSARPEITAAISERLTRVCESRMPDAMIISGKYGEGKTHLLNTVFDMARGNNMVVSFISLSKETPFDKPYLIYQKLLQNTYLPKRLQPGFFDLLSDITTNHPLSVELQAFTAKHLDTDKLFYLFRSYFHTDDIDEKHMLLADLEGDFINAATLKKIYKRHFSEKIGNVKFSKSNNMGDYFSAISYMFRLLGYNGWVMLFDETELIGRLGKKTRLKAYKNMAAFMLPDMYSNMQAAFCLFAVTSSFVEDVIDAKHEFENLKESGFGEEDWQSAESVLRAICDAKRLQPLTKDEIAEVMEKLRLFYRQAYDWDQEIDMAEIAKLTDTRGYLLRTRIRAAVECLDQLYLYNQSGDFMVNELGDVSYEEDIPELIFENS
jgi:hypothetical protein